MTHTFIVHVIVDKQNHNVWAFSTEEKALAWFGDAKAEDYLYLQVELDAADSGVPR